MNLLTLNQIKIKKKGRQKFKTTEMAQIYLIVIDSV